MKITAAICLTVLLCMVLGVAGYLVSRGVPLSDSKIFELLPTVGIGIGLLGNLLRTEHVSQKVERVEAQTNGTNSRLNALANTALAELPPEQAREVIRSVDTDTPTGLPPDVAGGQRLRSDPMSPPP